MLFVGTSIIHPSTEGVFLLCNILDLLIYRRKEEFERISKIFSLIQKTPSDYTTEIFLNEL